MADGKQAGIANSEPCVFEPPTDSNLGLRRVLWVTDPHFNFVNLPEWDRFINVLKAHAADAILLTGDVSEAEDFSFQLGRLAREIGLPVLFVLGNHDFFHGSIAESRRRANACHNADSHLIYMTSHAPISIGEGWTVIGDDGWADCRIGRYHDSPVQLADYQLIEDLQHLSAWDRLPIVRREGAASACRLRRQLESARLQSEHSGQPPRSILLTHIPPFREACWYRGKTADDDWAPFFTCYSVGWMLKRYCVRYPDHHVLVLCGHTHSAGKVQIIDNLSVWTGGAEYSKPRVAEVIELDQLATTTRQGDHVA